MKTGNGVLGVYLPNPANYFYQIEGKIEVGDVRVSIVGKKDGKKYSYPNGWCSIVWDEDEASPTTTWRECIELGCHREANLETGYCGSHSLY